MNYKENLKNYLKNIDGNLMADWMTDTTPLSELAGIAADSLYRKTPEGKIAALFIYHQQSIEMLKLLIIYADFYIKLSIYPTKYLPKDFKKINKYSEIINQLKFGISFNGKAKLIEYSTKINNLRNEFGHNIIENWDYDDIDEKLDDIGKIFKVFIDCWRNSSYELVKLVKKSMERPEIIKLIEK